MSSRGPPRGRYTSQGVAPPSRCSARGPTGTGRTQSHSLRSSPSCHRSEDVEQRSCLAGPEVPKHQAKRRSRCSAGLREQAANDPSRAREPPPLPRVLTGLENQATGRTRPVAEENGRRSMTDDAALGEVIVRAQESGTAGRRQRSRCSCTANGSLVHRELCESADAAADVVAYWRELEGVECVVDDLAARHRPVQILEPEGEETTPTAYIPAAYRLRVRGLSAHPRSITPTPSCARSRRGPSTRSARAPSLRRRRHEGRGRASAR
jgi:hypothetical protein